MAFATPSRISNFLNTGIDLFQLPSSPGFRQIEWAPVDATVSNISPYTRQEQVQMWAGGEYWAGTLTLPTLSRADAAAWTAALLALRGTTHAFQVQDQAYIGMQNPANAFGGQPSLGGVPYNGITHAPGTTAITTVGWPANQARVLTPGDYLQIGWRLHRVVGEVDSDAGGNAAIPIWPSLRETPAQGTSVDVVQPVGIFRRADKVLNWSTNYDGTTTLSFKIVEVR